MSSRFRREYLSPACSIALTALVTWSVLSDSVPLLRHDWRTPRAPGTVAPWIASFYQPWLPTGIGAPQPYPTFYWIGFVLWPFHQALSPLSVVALSVIGATLLAAFSAARIARNLGAGNLAACAVSCLAVLNPWVYSKYVAGHIFMVLAYAILLALAAETTRREPRPGVLVLLSAAAITQLQFFVIVLLPLSIWCLRTRRVAPLVALWIAALPAVLGIYFYYDSLRQTPYALSWQVGNSVPLLKGVLLRGYAFHYADTFALIWPALACIAAIAVYGTVRNWNVPEVRLASVFAVGALAVASGASGFLALPYTWIVMHVPESGLFRELYDLIAIVAIGYIVAVAGALGKQNAKALLFFTLAACISLAVPWIVKPISTFFVSGNTVPVAIFPKRPHERVALFPAFQPQTYGVVGTGYDPDLFEQTGRSMPLNEFFPDFPVEMALSYGWYKGDFRYLQDLGVSRILSRPYLQTAWSALRYQQAALSIPTALPANRALTAIPIIAYADDIPAIGTNPQDLASNETFFADGAQLRNNAAQFYAAASSGFNLDATWIDIRFCALAHPEWLTSFGGVATKSTAPLALPRGYSKLLAQVAGRLVNEHNQTIASSTPALRWWRIPSGSAFARCVGTCAVILAGTPPETAPARKAAWTSVRYQDSAPWLIALRLPPARRTRTLRFTEAYSPYWLALDGRTVLRHVRLNSSLNGWLAPPGTAGMVLLVQWAALVQFIAECIAAVTTIVLVIVLLPIRRQRPSPKVPSDDYDGHFRSRRYPAR